MFAELMALANKIKDLDGITESDVELLEKAAFKLIPGPDVKMERTDILPGYGYISWQMY